MVVSPDLTDSFLESAEFLQRHGCANRIVGLFLGPGFGSLAAVVDADVEYEAAAVAGWPDSEEEGACRILGGRLGSVEVMAWTSGRLTGQGAARSLGHGVRVLRELGGQSILALESCICLNPAWPDGGLTLVTDHLNLLGDNPLIGPDVEEHGVRFPDMTEVYSVSVREAARDLALDRGQFLREGIYAGVLGAPQLTAAERHMLRLLGADVAGSALISPAIVARHAGLRVTGLVSAHSSPGPDGGAGSAALAAASDLLPSLAQVLVA
ncbi:MAG: purine-nucleoside phosphorylase [Gemmatimonadota bacterium]